MEDNRRISNVIYATVRTNDDKLGRLTWPSEYQALPRVGDVLISSSLIQAKVCRISYGMDYRIYIEVGKLC